MVSTTFLRYVSYIIKGTSIKNINVENNNNLTKKFIESVKYPGLDEYVIRGIRFYLNENKEDFNVFLKEIDEILKYKSHDDRIFEFSDQILSFLKNAYINKTFFETIGRKIYATSENDFLLSNQNKSFEAQEKAYFEYLRLELMQHFKDIVVMYLGYDAIERFAPNGELIKIPYHPKDYATYFEKTPRIITTSYSNVNERFYNHLLMDWSVHKLPRYLWNEQTLKYEQEPTYRDFYYNQKEKILKKEINSIKRLVPLKDRYKYFR